MLLLVAVVHLFSLLYNSLLCVFAIIYSLDELQNDFQYGVYVPQCINARMSTGYIPKSEIAGPVLPSGILITCVLNQLNTAFISFNLFFIFSLPLSLWNAFWMHFLDLSSSSLILVLAVSNLFQPSMELISIIKFSF